jgi:hypothetical protein
MSFDTFLQAFEGQSTELPLVHNTTCERFIDIAKNGTLDPRPCAVFNEPLIYFFYGRPIYRPSAVGNKPDTRYIYCPVCLVFKPYAVEALARLYPFDSGAACSGRFSPHVAWKDPGQFSLDPTMLTARQLVEAFFETNERYYFGMPRNGLVIPAVEPEVQQFWSLINEDGEAVFDDRRSAIELQTRAAIALKNNLHAVILPAAFLDEAEVRQVVIQKWRAIPVTYETFRGSVPNEYVRIVVEKLRILVGDYL